MPQSAGVGLVAWQDPERVPPPDDQAPRDPLPMVTSVPGSGSPGSAMSMGGIPIGTSVGVATWRVASAGRGGPLDGPAGPAGRGVAGWSGIAW